MKASALESQCRPRPIEQPRRVQPTPNRGGIMGRFAYVLVAVTSLLTVCPTALRAQAGGGDALTDTAYVQHLVFDLPLSRFSAITRLRIGSHGSPGDTWFEWETDLCSAPLVGSTGRSFNFNEPCRRHDFAYRNTQLLERRYGGNGTYWNGASRKRIDRQLLADTKAHCSSRRLFDRPACYSWAYTFYRAVRVAGGP